MGPRLGVRKGLERDLPREQLAGGKSPTERFDETVVSFAPLGPERPAPARPPAAAAGRRLAHPDLGVVAMTLAERAGVMVPPFQLRQAARRPVFMMSRFDRSPSGRRPFCSALTALGAADGETRSYLELVDFLRQAGADAPADAAQLWRRMVFNILISNTDDHLRNHGFLREAGGWRLSPAYDLNPMPTDVKPATKAVSII